MNDPTRGLSPARQTAVRQRLPEDASFTELVARLQVEQRDRWKGGDRVLVEAFLQEHPALGEHADWVLDLVFREIALRDEAGETLDVDEYCRRFPAFATQLQALAADAPAPARGWPSVPGYEILAELGRGGMGVVYKARQVRLKRLVALKMIRHLDLAEASDLARFKNEAEALARLQHPNIVQIYEVGDIDGAPFLSLEYVDGGSLDIRLRDEALSTPAAAELVETLARAVHAAHEHGVIHRDLKPANVLLVSGGVVSGEWSEGSPTEHSPLTTHPSPLTPKITDFGLAKKLEDPTLKTTSGAILGTPNYMAPEQAQGRPEEIGRRTDVYALGAILYEILTGRPPFRAATPMDTLWQVLHEEPVPVTRLASRVPRDLETICLVCLRKEAERRYASALALAEDLQRFRAGQSIHARPVSTLERGWRWVCGRPALAGLLALSLLLAFVGFPSVTLLWLHADHEKQTAEHERQAKEAERQHARAAQEEAETALYFSRIAVADREYFANNVAGTRALLDLCSPQPERPDRRGWEWYYLDRLCHAYRFSFDGLTSYVQDVAFSPDGKLVAAAAGVPGGGIGDPPTTPGEVTLWNRDTGKLLKKLVHPGSVQSAGFSPDGRWLVSGCADGFVRLWDMATLTHSPAPEGAPQPTGQRRTDGEGLKLPGFHPRFAANSDTLVILRAGSIQLWDVAEQRERVTISTPQRPWTAFSSNGKWMALPGKVLTADGRYEVQIYDSCSGAVQRTTSLDSAHAFVTCVSPDGKRLVILDWDRLQIWDASTGKNVLELRGHVGLVNAARFSPDGRRLASIGDDQCVRVWDADYGAELLTLRGHTAPGASLAFSPDGNQLISGGKDGSAKIWDLTLGVQVPLGVNGEHVGAIAFADGGRTIWAALLHQQRLQQIDVARRVPAASHDIDLIDMHRAPRSDSSFTADGRLFAAVSKHDVQVVKVWETASGAPVATLSGHKGVVSAVALNCDGTRLASAALAVAPRERRVSSEVKIWDLATRQEIRSLPLGPSMATSIAFDPESGRLVVASSGLAPEPGKVRLTEKSAVRIWDVRDGQELLALEGDHGLIASVVFSPDGRRIASAGFADPTVRVWDASTGHLIFGPLRAFPSPLTSVAFSPDGKRLAATGYAGLVKLWDAATGDEVLTLRGPGTPASGQYAFTPRVIFSPDGQFIAANTWLGGINLWQGGP
jgi:WD40 repeat protein